MLLQRYHELGVRRYARRGNDIGLHDHAARLVRRTNDPALDDRGMREQSRLDVRTCDVVASRHDHVVRARLVPEIALAIHQIGVARDVPAVLDVFALPLVGEIAASGRPAYRELSYRARRYVIAGIVDDLRF